MRGGRLMMCGALPACSLGSEDGAAGDLRSRAPRAATPRRSPASRRCCYLPEVTAPAWLNGPGIVYRLNYDNPAAPAALRPEPVVGVSRRAADRAPAQPFRGCCRERHRDRRRRRARRLPAARRAGGFQPVVRRAELEPGRAPARARASSASRPAALVAQRAFAVEQAAPTPDAPGAVQALSAASEEFMEALLKWTRSGSRPPAASDDTQEDGRSLRSHVMLRYIRAVSRDHETALR